MNAPRSIRIGSGGFMFGGSKALTGPLAIGTRASSSALTLRIWNADWKNAKPFKFR